MVLQVKGGTSAQAAAQSAAQAIGTAVATAVASASTKVTTTALLSKLPHLSMALQQLDTCVHHDQGQSH